VLTTYDESDFGIETLDYGLTVSASAGQLKSVEFYPTDTNSVYEYASSF